MKVLQAAGEVDFAMQFMAAIARFEAFETLVDIQLH